MITGVTITLCTWLGHCDAVIADAAKLAVHEAVLDWDGRQPPPAGRVRAELRLWLRGMLRCTADCWEQLSSCCLMLQVRLR